jgi:hypothetical protein
MSSEVVASLDAIDKLGSHAQKIEEYKKLADRLFQSKGVPSLITFLSRLADDPPSSGEAVPTIISRQVLQDFVTQIFESALARDQVKELGNVTLTKLRTRQSAFEEQITLVSEKMADILQVLNEIFRILSLSEV